MLNTASVTVVFCFPHATKNSFRRYIYSASFQDHIWSYICVSASRHQFVRPPYSYYWLYVTKIYEVWLAFSGITFIPNFMNVVQLVRNSKGETHNRQRGYLVSLLLSIKKGNWDAKDCHIEMNSDFGTCWILGELMCLRTCIYRPTTRPVIVILRVYRHFEFEITKGK
jgi:hypothetical protein